MAPETAFADHEIIDADEGAPVEAQSLSTLTKTTEAEVNQQIMTAHAYPRNVTSFRRQLQEMTCYDAEMALSCIYTLKRGGKIIQGPSIRFAEAALNAWGNARVGSRIVDIGDDFVTAQGFFWDLEKNTGIAFEVLNRITNKEGERYGDDMIMTAGNAAGSKAVRNAIVKGIPRTAWEPVYKKCRKLSVGEGDSITANRDNLLKAFAPLGVDEAQILGYLGVKGMADVGIEEMITMNGVLTAIKDGATSVLEAFHPDNMSNPDQVRPPEPRRNDFAGKKQPEKKPEVASKVTQRQEPEPPAQDREGGQAAQSQTVPATDERGDLVKDAYTELAACDKVKRVGELRERIIDQGFMTDSEERDWHAACDAKGNELVERLKQQRNQK